ncbi:MAG TPA: tetratricopeptide repeat protein [Gemmatimonadaceae bacterium]
MTPHETHFRRESKSSHAFAATRPGSHAQEARELVARAREHQHRGSVAEACVAFEMALALIDGAPTSPLHTDLHRWHGALLFDIGSTSEAEALFRRSLETAQFIRYAIGIARAQASLARVAHRRGDLAAARRQYDDASLNAVASGDHALFARIELDLGALSVLLGDVEDATQRFRLSMRALGEAGDDAGVAWALDNLAQLRVQRGRLDEARGAVAEGLAIAEQLGDALLQQRLWATAAEIAFAAADTDECAAASGRALSLASTRGDRLGRAQGLRFRARVEARRGATEQAVASLDSARALAAQSEDLLMGARVLVEYGDVLASRGQTTRARTAWEQARAAYARLGMPPEAIAVGRRLSPPG